MKNYRELIEVIYHQDKALWDFYRVDGFFDDYYPRYNSKIFLGKWVAHPMHGAYLINRLVAYGKKTKDVRFFQLANILVKSSISRMDDFDGGALAFFYRPGDGVNKFSHSFYSGLTQCRYINAIMNLGRVAPSRELSDSLRRIALSMIIDVQKGGVLLNNTYGTFIEEYPSSVPKYVLNGWLTALNILINYSNQYDDKIIKKIAEESSKTLLSNLNKYDMPEKMNSAYSLTSGMKVEFFSDNFSEFNISSVTVKSRAGDIDLNFKDRSINKKLSLNIEEKGEVLIKTIQGVISLNLEVSAISDEYDDDIFIKVVDFTGDNIFMRLFDVEFDVITGNPIYGTSTKELKLQCVGKSNNSSEFHAKLPSDIVRKWAKRPNAFYKKINNVNYNVYHFVHINGLIELLQNTYNEELKCLINKWINYYRGWRFSGLYGDISGISFEPYYKLKSIAANTL